MLNKDIEEQLRSGNYPIKDITIESLRFKDDPFTAHVRFVRCRFRGETNFARAIFFRGLTFIACVFEDKVTFEAARVDGDCGFRAVQFCGNATFDRLVVNGKLDMRAESLVEDREIVTAALAAGMVSFRPVHFGADVSFNQMHVAGEVNLGSARFLGSAEFYNARIDGSLLLRRDKDKMQPNVGFDGVEFAREVRFRDARVGGELNFHGAQFASRADFSMIRCNGPAFFCDPKPDFGDPTPCKFKGVADFSLAHFQQLHLGRTIFEGGVDFTDTRYRRIEVIDDSSYRRLRKAFRKPRANDLGQEAHRKPVYVFERTRWLQLESVLRRQGESAAADHIYRERVWRSGAPPLMRRLSVLPWWLLSGFGTLPLLPVLWCVVTVCVFARFEHWDFLGSFLHFFPQDLGPPEVADRTLLAVSERVAGWVLLPATVASVAGFLNRKASAGEIEDRRSD